MPRRATALALLPVLALLIALGTREYIKGGVLTGDTLQLLDGTAAIDSCLHQGKLRCNSGVGFWPPLQYIPALALKRLGASRSATGNYLIYLNGLAVLGTLCLLWLVGRRSRAPGVAPLLVLAALVSPLLWYADTGFGEALATVTTTAMVVSLLLGWNPVITAVTCCLAVISKETALPFVIAFGAIAFAVRLAPRRPIRTDALALGAGAAGGVALIASLNLFRYGVPWNRYYVRSGWQVASLPRRAEFFGAELVAPNAGLVWFWPIASLLIAFAAYHGARIIRATRIVRSGAGAVVAAVVTFTVLLATFASWWSPFGWFALGNRLIVPWVPPLVAVLGAACAEPIYRAFCRLVATRVAFFTVGVVVLVLGLAELGAMLQPVRPFGLFQAGNCAYVPRLLDRIPAGDPVAHAAQDACLSDRAWNEQPALADSLHALGGTDVWFAILYVAAVVGLLATALIATASGETTNQSSAVAVTGGS